MQEHLLGTFFKTLNWVRIATSSLPRSTVPSTTPTPWAPLSLAVLEARAAGGSKAIPDAPARFCRGTQAQPVSITSVAGGGGGGPPPVWSPLVLPAILGAGTGEGKLFFATATSAVSGSMCNLAGAQRSGHGAST